MTTHYFIRNHLEMTDHVRNELLPAVISGEEFDL